MTHVDWVSDNLSERFTSNKACKCVSDRERGGGRDESAKYE